MMHLFIRLTRAVNNINLRKKQLLPLRQELFTQIPLTPHSDSVIE